MTAGFHDIHDEADLGGSSDSVANDINEDGLVVGVSGGVGPLVLGAAGEATLWTLGDPVESEPLGILTGGEWSVAYGINDDGSTPTIVGTSETEEPFCEGFDTIPAPFWLVYNSSSIALLPPINESAQSPHHAFSDAYDVNNTGDVQIVGTTLLFDSSCIIDVPYCISEANAALWVVSGGTPTFSTLPPLASSSFLREEIARGNNDTGEIVGMVKTGTGGNDCEERAGIWEGSSHVLTNLGALLSTTEKFSIAEAVNNRDEEDRLQAVGRNISANTAARWRKDPNAQTEWVATHLIDLICEPCSTGWNLRDAHDINDDGWIVGWGTKDGVATAFLLIPLDECEEFSCPGDLDLMNGVNTLDLGILLSSLSPDPESLALGCPEVVSCPADLNCDGAVNSLDLGILLLAWGPCPGDSMMLTEPPSLDDLILIFCDLGHEDKIGILVEVWESIH